MSCTETSSVQTFWSLRIARSKFVILAFPGACLKASSGRRPTPWRYAGGLIIKRRLRMSWMHIMLLKPSRRGLHQSTSVRGGTDHRRSASLRNSTTRPRTCGPSDVSSTKWRFTFAKPKIFHPKISKQKDTCSRADRVSQCRHIKKKGAFQQ